MVSPNEKRVVSYDPPPRLHLVSKKDFCREQIVPGRVPEYDDAREVRLRIDTLDRIPPAITTAGAKVMFIDKIKRTSQPERAIHPNQAIQASKPKLLSASELHQLYDGTSVPAHRYLSGLLSTAVNSPAIAMDPAKWLAGISVIDLPGVVANWLNTNKSTAYEQLNSIGLDANTSRLTGVLAVKQRSGYAGGPSTAGSREFVAFWVDWGSGFQYQGTTSVAVHDFSSLPADGLEYKVFLPVDLPAHAQPGSKDARTVNVRAVLSWNTPPSTTDPCAPVVWGNSLDGIILIPPGINVSSGASSGFNCAPAGFCLRAMSWRE
jgi:hypothetical protein